VALLKRKRPNVLRRGLCGVALALVVVGPVQAVGPQDEYVVKSAFLLNFGRLIEWPSEHAAPADGPFVICVRDGGEALDSVERGARDITVNDRPVEVRRAPGAARIGECHVLFVTARAGAGGELLRAATLGHVLTVGEAPGLAADGFALNFFSVENRTRFEVNRAAAEAAGLRLGSRLLRLARIVEGRTP